MSEKNKKVVIGKSKIVEPHELNQYLHDNGLFDLNRFVDAHSAIEHQELFKEIDVIARESGYEYDEEIEKFRLI